jgi:type II secretory pathway pseudopilin PulG
MKWSRNAGWAGNRARRASLHGGFIPPGYGSGAGFTLLDLLIVVAVLSILAMAVAPSIGPMLAEARLSRAASDVALALDFARYRSISTGGDSKVEINAPAGSISVLEFQVSADVLTGATVLAESVVENGTLQPVMHPVNRGLPYVIDLAQASWFTPVNIGMVDFGGSTAVTFRAMGIPSAPGMIQLTLGERERTIEVTPGSGTTVISE